MTRAIQLEPGRPVSRPRPDNVADPPGARGSLRSMSCAPTRTKWPPISRDASSHDSCMGLLIGRAASSCASGFPPPFPCRRCEQTGANRLASSGRRATRWIVIAGVSPERRRFSIAHEVGQWEQRRGQSFACRDEERALDKAAKTKERDADDYASSLMMPTDLFKDAIRSSKGGVAMPAISALAATFKACTVLHLVDEDLLVERMSAKRAWRNAE